MNIRMVIIAVLFSSLLGCNSDYYQRSRDLTLSSEANKGFSEGYVYQEYSCAPNLVVLKADGTVEVDWGKDPTEECGQRSQNYSVEFEGNGKYKVTAENQSHYIKVVELESHVYGAKKLGNNPFVVYIIAE